MYRKYVGKCQWLAENCRPDLAFTALQLSRKSSGATLGDLKRINDVVDKIRGRKNVVRFKKIGKKEDLIVTGVGDASYKIGEKGIGGNIVMLRCKDTEDVLPLFWKSKQIKKVCHSLKEAETRNILKLVDESLYQGLMLEQVCLTGKEKFWWRL